MKYTLLILGSIVIGIFLQKYTPRLFTYKTKELTEVIYITPTPTPGRPEVIYEISKQFDKYGADVMAQSISVAKNESGWKHNAQGWNCIYDKDGRVKAYKTEITDVSKACKDIHRSLSWSVDCGVMQINVKGKVCPTELFDIKKNIEKAASMYEHRKWSPWVAAHNLGYVN